MLRKCGRCGALKPLAEFAWRRKEKGQRDNYCRPCRAAYHRKHYQANRQRYLAQAKRRKGRNRARNYRQLIDFLSAHPCVDCGDDDVLVLEFDHVAGKSILIAKALRDRFWEDILAEIAKCEVVCANCHRRRTARRGGFARFIAAQPPDEPAA
ncbi:MAG: hypothetical protein ACT4PI_01090 [Actinomycetota bacterium]